MDYKMQEYYFFSDSLALLWLEERSKVRQSITRHPRSFCSGGIGSFSDSTKQNNQWIISAVRRNSQKQVQNNKLKLNFKIKTECCFGFKKLFYLPSPQTEQSIYGDKWPWPPIFPLPGKHLWTVEIGVFDGGF